MQAARPTRVSMRAASRLLNKFPCRPFINRGNPAIPRLNEFCNCHLFTCKLGFSREEKGCLYEARACFHNLSLSLSRNLPMCRVNVSNAITAIVITRFFLHSFSRTCRGYLSHFLMRFRNKYKQTLTSIKLHVALERAANVRR